MSASHRDDQRKQAVTRLRTAFNQNSLCLYVGAGASAASRVPTWHDLVLIVFLNSLGIIGREPQEGAVDRAVSELWFAKNRVPLEIVARELRNAFDSPDQFMELVHFALYQSFGQSSEGQLVGLDDLCKDNKTLAAIVSLCRNTKPGRRGLRSIVTYNLDGLLEVALESYPFQSMWKRHKGDAGRLPIYHVHGYLPARGFFHTPERNRSTSDEIVLTEDQYHREAENPYSWSNLVQLQALSGSVGLTIGLSLVDPNMRRLLDVSKRLPLRPEMYALLSRPDTVELSDQDLLEIGERTGSVLEFDAQRHNWQPPPAPDLSAPEWQKRVRKTWSTLARIGAERQASVLRELGVEPVWCRHSEIPEIVERIVRR